MNIYSILYTYIRHDIQIPPFYACYNIVAGDDKHSNGKKKYARSHWIIYTVYKPLDSFREENSRARTGDFHIRKFSATPRLIVIYTHTRDFVVFILQTKKKKKRNIKRRRRRAHLPRGNWHPRERHSLGVCRNVSVSRDRARITTMPRVRDREREGKTELERRGERWIVRFH